jgi:molecular chaperone GrpE (heat shock protein)
VKLTTVQDALRAIPEVTEAPPASGEVEDVLGAAAEFSKLLRKAGIQQSREVREMLSSLQEPGGQSEQIRDAWQREQQRATGSEQQLRKLAEVLIATLDILDRMVAAFEPAHMEEWRVQTRQAVDLCIHNAEKVGLVPLGIPGEPFDIAVHDLTREVPRDHRGPIQVGSVITRGYSLNGKVLRRAEVDYVA